MAINIHCKNCATDMKLTAKICPNTKCKTIIPARGRTYRVVVRVHGKRTSQMVTNLEFAREIEAKLKKDNIRNEHDISEKVAAPTLDAFWDQFLPWAKQNKKSWKTDYYYYRKHLQPLLGPKYMDQIAPFDVEKLILKLRKGKNQHGRPYADATIKHILVLLSRLYSKATMMGLYDGKNPCKRVEKPELNNVKTKFMSLNDLSRLHNVLNTWPDRMSVSFILFALHTGFRRGELFKLRWREDVDMIEETATLRDPKGKKDAVLPLSGEAIKVLQNIPLEHDTEYIFYGRGGRQRTDFSGPWKRIRKAAGLDDFTFNDLRHAFASQLVSEGVSIYIVQELLTHKSPTTTQRYAHLDDATLRNAVGISDGLLKQKAPKVVNTKEINNA